VLDASTYTTLSFEDTGDQSAHTLSVSRNTQNLPTGDLIIPSKVIYNNEEYTVTVIVSSAFSGCSGLKSITIPVTVTTFYYSIFEDCTDLKDIYFEGSEEDWNKISNLSYAGIPTDATIHFTEV